MHQDILEKDVHISVQRTSYLDCKRLHAGRTKLTKHRRVNSSQSGHGLENIYLKILLGYDKLFGDS